MADDFDSLLIVPFDARRNLTNFAREISEMWPAAIIELFDVDPEEVVSEVLDAGSYPEYAGISFVRDRDMDGF